MKKMIKDAVVSVLTKNGEAMTVNEVYKQIIADRLYDFNAKDPISVLRAAIRKHCKDLQLKKSSSEKKFEQIDKDKYRLI